MIAVVTGAGSGIGRAVSRALIEAGWSVVAAGRREAPLRETLGGADGLAVPTDVTDPASVDALFAARCSATAASTCCSTTPAWARRADRRARPTRTGQRVVDTNLTGSFLCAQAAFRAMAAQDPRGGRIINNGSLSAYVPRPYAIAYTATKHAVTGPHQVALARGPRVRHRLRADRHRQRGDRHDRADGRGRPAGRRLDSRAEPTMDVDARRAAPSPHMASLPLDANVQFMTIMATKMPFIGRG